MRSNLGIISRPGIICGPGSFAGLYSFFPTVINRAKILLYWLVQSTPDNSNLQGKLKKVRVIGSSSYRRKNYIESDLKGKENCFELAGGSSCRESIVVGTIKLYQPLAKMPEDSVDLISPGSGITLREMEVTQQPAAVICVKPASSLIDEEVRILASKLEPNQTVTLEARIVGDKGEAFQSHAHYVADKEREVNVCSDTSLGGSYGGVEPMGLLWSMKAAPGQRKGVRLLKSDVTKPYVVEVKCYNGHITPHESLASPRPLSSATFQEWYMADGVKRIPVREGRIRGTLFIPPGDGPFPGM